MEIKWRRFATTVVVLLIFLCLGVSFSQSPHHETNLESRATELYLKGLSYYYSGDYEEATFLLEEALKLFPDSEEIRRSLGACYFQLGTEAYQRGELDQAKECFFKVIEYLPDDFRGYQNLSLILINLKDYEKAAEIAQRGLRIKEDSRQLLLFLAECYRQKGKRQRVLDVFEKLHKYYPDDLEIALTLGQLYRVNRKASEAMKLYKKLKEDYPEEKRVYERIAEIHSSGFRYNKAREEYQALLKFYPDDTAIKEKIAELLRLEKKYRDAQGIYEDLLEAFPRKFSYYVKIAEIYEEEGNIPSAINTYKRAEKIFSEDSLVHKELGRLFELQGSLPEAEKMYKKMIELDPAEPYPWVRLGILYEKRGDFDSATASFGKAAELGSINPLAYYKLGTSCEGPEEALGYIKLAIEKALGRIKEIKGSLFGRVKAFGGGVGLSELVQFEKETQTLDQPKKILKRSLEELLSLRKNNVEKLELDLKTFLEDHPNSEELLEELGVLYEKEQRLGEAVAIWERLLNSNVKSVRAHLGLARAYERLRRCQEAILAYKRVVEIDVTCREAYLGLIRLYGEKGELDLLKEQWEKKAKIRSSATLLEYLARLKEKL